MCAQIIITIVGSILNKIWGGGYVYDHLMSMRIFNMIMGNIFIQSPKMMRNAVMASIWLC